MATTRRHTFRIGVYGSAGGVVLLVLLNPYARQSLLGPKIEGLPLCYWQDSFRRYVDPVANRDSATTRVVRWLGFDQGHQPTGLPGKFADALPVLLSLVDDPQPNVRAMVAVNLKMGFRSDEVAPPLLRLLDDPEACVRAAAAKALGDVRPPVTAALPRLVQLLDDADMDCRLQAASAVGQLGPQHHGQVVSILRVALKDPNSTTRLKAVRVMGRAWKAAAEALPDLAVCAAADPHPHVRHDAFALLLAFGPDAKGAVPALLSQLRHADEPVRACALAALQCIDPEQFPPPRTAPR